MATHEFGGDWTEEKLGIVQQYLKPYIKIFTTNEIAKQYLSTVYIDAFAGSGEREEKKGEEQLGSVSLFDMFGADSIENETRTPQTFKGSAQYALELEPSFDRYIFIEKKKEFVEALRLLCNEFPDKKNVSVRQGNAKDELKKIFEGNSLSGQRALVFLDPYGMQVDWETIRIIAKPQKVDLWLLWPIGLAINRMVSRNKLPEEAWAKSLDLAFGTREWQDRFYDVKIKPPTYQMNMFNDEVDEDETHAYEKVVNIDGIRDYFVERLMTVFDYVAEEPRWLLNRQGRPIYMLCFASHNPTALKIAKHLLKK